MTGVGDAVPAATYVPMVGRIAAGGPILAEERTEEVFPLPKTLVGEGTLFMLQVAGDSMVDAAICDGDYVVVRQEQTAENGDIVAALLDGEATVKTFQRKDGHVWLLPHNDAYQPDRRRPGDHPRQGDDGPAQGVSPPMRYNRTVTVLVVGGANLDVLARSTARLQPGTSNPGTTVRTPGGVARNVAENLARLGTPTRLLLAVGDDTVGAEVLARTRFAGVQTIRVPWDGPTGTYTALLDHDGGLVAGVADMAATAAIAPEHVDDADVAAADWLVLDGNLPPDTLGHALHLAADAGVPVAARPGQRAEGPADRAAAGRRRGAHADADLRGAPGVDRRGRPGRRRRGAARARCRGGLAPRGGARQHPAAPGHGTGASGAATGARRRRHGCG